MSFSLRVPFGSEEGFEAIKSFENREGSRIESEIVSMISTPIAHEHRNLVLVGWGSIHVELSFWM
jgi:hypothetical protein